MLNRKRLISSVQRSGSFVDYFTRSNGAVGNNWTGVTWSISGNKVVNTPTVGGNLLTNPGLEAPYSSGLANGWSKNGTPTIAQETTTIHQGSSSQKISSSTVNSGVFQYKNATLIAGQWYRIYGWGYKESGGDSRVSIQLNGVVARNLVLSTGVWEKNYLLGKFSSGNTGVNFKVSEAAANVLYGDDAFLGTIDFSSLFLTRPYHQRSVVVKAAVNWSGVANSHAGVVIALDNPANPQNFVTVYYGSTGVGLVMSKWINGVETVLITGAQSSITWNDGELVEIRRTGNTFQLFYRGIQEGTDQTITNPEIINNRYVGIWCDNESAFNGVSVQKYGDDMAVPTFVAPVATYTAGQGVLSLRFDDAPKADYTEVFPRLTARGLVAGFACIRNNWQYMSAANMSLSDVLEMQAAGMEIMDHTWRGGATGNPPTSWTEFRQLANQAAGEFRLMGLDVNSLVEPGAWGGSDYDMDALEDVGSAVDLYIRKNHLCYEAYIYPWERPLPVVANTRYGASHGTVNSSGGLTLITAKARIDTFIADGTGGEFTFHTGTTTTGDLSWTDFEDLLDYIAMKVSAGTLKVLTPTQQLFATPV